MVKKFIGLLVAAMFLASCAANLTPWQRAAGPGYETGNVYFSLKAQYLAKLDSKTMTEEQKIAFSQQVVPVLNKLKAVDLAYLHAIDLWADTGTKPPDYEQLQVQLNTLITEIMALFAKGGK